ncbi:ATP-binding protein [Polluticoccus soli]|uniref:ATP-binding protein n=1 Tax=Polluticoccus soli TaxID=3034150 RepID=UPI0023E17435|nr:ATP-binding protein [Flavipsychrobacter sp. JY13-12]
MSKDLTITVEQDHIESLTRANGITALSELIWNALDADATEVRVNYHKNALGKYEKIVVQDNGHGLEYTKAEEVFKRLGGSQKKSQPTSPNGRPYHGKEGKGRYKSFALGDLVQFESIYSENGSSKTFNLTIDRNTLRKPILGDLKSLPSKASSSFVVTIHNIDDKVADEAFRKESRSDLQEKFASYHISYPDFQIVINGQNLEFDNLKRNTFEKDIDEVLIEDKRYTFKIKVIEWNFDNKKKTYLCGDKGIPFKEIALGIRSSLPISIFIQSDYIEKLHRENKLVLSEMDENVEAIYNEAKKIARNYVRERLHFYSKEFINDLKREKVYPYTDEAVNDVEIAKRQVFDIVALQVNEYLPSFNEQDIASKKLTLMLLKEALESNTSSLQKILAEVVGLPDDKRDELADLLEKTSLENIIDTMKELTDRLTFLRALELLIYDPEHSKSVLERRHLHKIIVKETWVFGDEYTYGADDITLQNVLRQYLKELGREDFEEVVKSEDNSQLQTIPDVCLWKQFSTGAGKSYINLVVELKKPDVDAGFDQLRQIQSYAQKVIKDSRFPKENTKWVFILLTRNIKDEIEPQVGQQHREYGHVTEHSNADVWVLPWGNIIQKAKIRYQYVKDKVNINFSDNENALALLKEKYSEYLPENFDAPKENKTTEVKETSDVL